MAEHAPPRGFRAAVQAAQAARAAARMRDQAAQASAGSAPWIVLAAAAALLLAAGALVYAVVLRRAARTCEGGAVRETEDVTPAEKGAVSTAADSPRAPLRSGVFSTKARSRELLPGSSLAAARELGAACGATAAVAVSEATAGASTRAVCVGAAADAASRAAVAEGAGAAAGSFAAGLVEELLKQTSARKEADASTRTETSAAAAAAVARVGELVDGDTAASPGRPKSVSELVLSPQAARVVPPAVHAELRRRTAISFNASVGVGARVDLGAVTQLDGSVAAAAADGDASTGAGVGSRTADVALSTPDRQRAVSVDTGGTATPQQQLDAWTKVMGVALAAEQNALHRQALSLRASEMQRRQHTDGERNLLMSDQNLLAAESLQSKARREADRAHRRRVAELRAQCADALGAGAAIMLAVAAAGAWLYGADSVRAAVVECAGGLALYADNIDGSGLGHKKSWFAWLARHILRTIAASDAFSLFACGAMTAWRAAWGFALAGAVAFAALRGGTSGRGMAESLRDTHTAPLSAIAIALGGIAGVAGYYALDSVGGDATVWLIGWEILCCAHVFVAYAAGTLVRAMETSRSSDHGGPVMQAAFVALLAVAAPATVGALPWARAALIQAGGAGGIFDALGLS